MNPTLEKALVQLHTRNIKITRDLIKEHEHQGFMSTVYTAESNIGKLIVQITKLLAEHENNKAWEKFQGLGTILAAHPEIPTSKILYADYIDGSCVIAQTFLEGERAGERVLEEMKIIDEWHADESDALPKVLKALAATNAVTLDSFGWQAMNTNTDRVVYSSWREFLEKESPRWIEVISMAEEGRSDAVLTHEKLEKFVRNTIAKVDYDGPPVLVHGDAINPSNVLVHNNDIALLDWEWAIAADPAWEFCDIGWKQYRDEESLAPYFEAADIPASEQRVFIERINLYVPFWLLWGAHMHTKSGNMELYLALRNAFLEEIGSSDAI